MDDPLLEQRKSNFRTYDNTIKYYMRLARKTYFHITFAMYKNDRNKTWAVICEMLNRTKTRCTRGVRVVFSRVRMRSSNNARMSKPRFTTVKIMYLTVLEIIAHRNVDNWIQLLT